MKLKVPVNSYESAVKQIAAGADEIYLGLEDDHFARMSYSARAKITARNVRSNLAAEEFSRIAAYARAKQVKVILTANCQHVSQSTDDFYRQGYIEYVRRGIELGAAAIIVADIGNLVSLKKHSISIPVIAGSYFVTFNRETVDFLRQLGVVRVCLPDQMTLEEIKSLKESTDLEIEIFIGYGCSNLSGSCNFCHNNGESKRVGVPCRANFRTKHYGTSSILDACGDCAICSLPKLLEIGVDSLKLIGRETDCIEASVITKMYKTAIQEYVATGKIDRSAIVSAVPWWEAAMCPNRCKYENTPLVESYI